MSTPSHGPQYDGQNQGPQYGGQPGGYGGQSLGQGYGQGGYVPGGPPPQSGPGGPAAPGGQPGPGGQPQGAGGAGGLADLFSDFAFRKSLTAKIASIAFLATVVWAVLDFFRVLAYAWGSKSNGAEGQFERSIRNMGGFEAMMTTLEGLAWMVFVIIVARLLLELCVNVARLARDKF